MHFRIALHPGKKARVTLGKTETYQMFPAGDGGKDKLVRMHATDRVKSLVLKAFELNFREQD
ncbi:hypothetical protein ACLOJK_013028 [Asimina triloba]